MDRKKMNDEAVSPVIGVILMVAITVILAAVVATFVLTQTDKLDDSTNKLVSLQGSATHDSVTVELAGGADMVELTKLKFSFGGAYPTYITANGHNISVTDGVMNPDAKDGMASIFEGEAFKIGDVFQMKNDGGKFTVTGTFADGTEQPLYTKMLPVK